MPKIRLPAEWEAQDAILLTWPHAQSDWLPYLEEVQSLYEQLITCLLPKVSVILACPPDAMEGIVASLKQSKGIPLDVEKTDSGWVLRTHLASSCAPACWLYPVASNDTWARDHGPITVENAQGQPMLLDFQFNGWGNKFAATLDNAISLELHRQCAFGDTAIKTGSWVLEGGAIESDGRGTLLTTTQCLLNQNRNGPTSEEQVEAQLLDALGVERVLWLNNGYLAGDDTDSHIDTLARLAPNDTIVYVACDDPDDEHYRALSAMEEELKAFKTVQGAPYRLLPLPWPTAKYAADGERLPATYANFLITNGCVVVPTYGDAQDDQALHVVRRAFPDREVIGLDCSVLIEQHGSLHCITMQLPRGVLPQSMGWQCER